MSTTTPPPGDDEAQVLAAWRALPKLEPTAALDQRILAAARAQVAAPPTDRSAAPHGATPAGGATPGHRPRWPALWATAAVFTLAVGVSWQLRQEHPGVATPPAPAVAPPPMLERAEQKATVPADAETARRQRDADAGSGPAAASADLATASGVAAAEVEARAAPRAETMSSNEAEIMEAADAADAATEATPMLQSAPMPQAKREALQPQAAPPAATMASRPPAAPAPLPEPVPPAREADTQAGLQPAYPAAPAVPAEPFAARAPVAADSTDAAATAIARIRELLAAGQIDAARDAAAAFAVDHPQARLPDDLAFLLAPR